MFSICNSVITRRSANHLYVRVMCSTMPGLADKVRCELSLLERFELISLRFQIILWLEQLYKCLINAEDDTVLAEAKLVKS